MRGIVSAAVVAGLAWPAAASGQLLAEEAAGSSVTGNGQRAVWSHYDEAGGRYHLVTSLGGGPAAPLPVAGRGVPFDVSLGTDRAGRELAVYSRCRRDASYHDRSTRTFLPDYAGAGCDVYRYDFASGRERRARGAARVHASEYLPSVSRGRLAFARIDLRRDSRRRRAHRIRVVGLAGGRVIRDIRPSNLRDPWLGVEGVAIRGRRVTWIWDAIAPCRTDHALSDDDVASELWTTTLRGKPVRLGRGCNADPIAMFASPSMTASRVYAAAAGPGSARDSPFRLLAWPVEQLRARPRAVPLPPCLSSAIVASGWLYTSRLRERPEPEVPPAHFDVSRQNAQSVLSRAS